MLIESIALQMTPGIGCAGAAHLLEVFGDARAVFAASAEELIERAELRPDLAAELLRKSCFAAAEREVERCRRADVRPIPLTDPAYPPLLREIPNPPTVLYVMGDPAALKRPSIALVGTRSITPYGSEQCRRMVKGLAERIPRLAVVSDLAEGIPVETHRVARACGATSVAVVPCVLPRITPAHHTGEARLILENGGAIVSELHAQVTQIKPYYVLSCRLIAALSSGCIVIEAPAKSGALNSARCADEFHRTVMALSGRPTDANMEGAHELIRSQKAQLVTSADDVIRELMWDFEGAASIPAPPPAPPAAEKRPPKPAPPKRSPNTTVRYTDPTPDMRVAADVTAVQPEAAEQPAPPVFDEACLSPDEERVLACFSGSDPCTLKEVQARTGFGVQKAYALLVQLEFGRQLIRGFNGYRYLRRCD